MPANMQVQKQTIKYRRVIICHWAELLKQCFLWDDFHRRFLLQLLQKSASHNLAASQIGMDDGCGSAVFLQLGFSRGRQNKPSCPGVMP
jgi:hypothetical protein